MKYLFYLVFLHLTVAISQINLHHTGWVRENENNGILQHDCLRFDVLNEVRNFSREIIHFCMSELPTEFHIEENNIFPKFTFDHLSKQNITSEQLYLWSAPIDIIEDYQLYLNQLPISNDLELSKNVFYNCTLPRFGSMCQYEIDHHHSNYPSLYEMINGFYQNNSYYPADFTCYTHLKCNRGHSPACLDWTEICNGQIDCLNGGVDEEYCWQLEINECNEDEHRCNNGQCIHKSFYQDDITAVEVLDIYDCLDSSDEDKKPGCLLVPCRTAMPSFRCEDIIRTKLTAITTSCVDKREDLIWDSMYSSKDNSTSNECWSAFLCVLMYSKNEDFKAKCNNICKHDKCLEIIEHNCTNMLYIPTIPVLFGDIYFAYEKLNSTMLNHKAFQIPYVCYNNSRYDNYFIKDPNKLYNYSSVLFNNLTCYHYVTQFLFNQVGHFVVYEQCLPILQKELWRYHETYNYNSTICNRSNIYQCSNSLKCISKHRRMDGVIDCPNSDDENKTLLNYTDSTEEIIDTDGEYADELNLQIRDPTIHISFQTICDGFLELSPIPINGQNETDETECEYWPCNNIYTNCDGLWNCPNGADETGCDLSSNCSSDEHKCVSHDTNRFICLPISKANDGKVDCIGATDEPTLCRTEYQDINEYNFYCMNQSLEQCRTFFDLCDNENDCDYGDDEKFCTTDTQPSFMPICFANERPNASDVENFLCNQIEPYSKERIIYFILNRTKKSPNDRIKHIENEVRSSIITGETQKPDLRELRCHRGIDVHMRSKNTNNRTDKMCFCPPSYYGDRCQYQNQRVSLSIRFKALSDSWQTPFAIVILLIDDDNEQMIHSYEQLTYLSMRDCENKSHLYLTYSNRPKNETKNYGIHIDIYEKISLKYRASLFFPIQFIFLPVHRLSLLINIPNRDINMERCSNNLCINGQCIKYSNNQEKTFCQCHTGWFGRYCTIKHSSKCSLDSTYINVSPNNQSICVCPLNKFGPRCLLDNPICQNNKNLTCKNDGKCIPNDRYMISSKNFTCICPEGYIGDRCELKDNKIIISFEKSISLPESIFIHFIEVINNDEPKRSTIFQTIPVHQDFITIFWSRPFHIVFIEVPRKNYYLTFLQNVYNESTINNKMINPSDRCQHINEIFNDSMAKLHLIRRIKYYHLPCQMYSLNRSCFYDNTHFCLCYNYGQIRLANCFEFNHSMKFDCSGHSECQNGAECFQDTAKCPKKLLCMCPRCFYGRRCQFTTRGFGLSLDNILGYHILPQISITHQTSIVKVSIALTIIFMIVGFINGILSIITFKNKSVREVGCGIYLLGSSITTLLTMIIFGLKFWILILAQMSVISNELFLKIQCISLDYLLRICLNMDQWLNAAVACERAITIIKATRFVKKKSKQAAKLVIILLLIFNIIILIHDPIYRRILIDEENDNRYEKRIWCIVKYSPGLGVFNNVLHTFQFFVPFMINLIAAVILIVKKTNQQSTIQVNRNRKEILHENYRQHKHLFIAPVVLVILAIPRLAISYSSQCMQTSKDAWLFLIAYFISIIPPMLTFIIFILPSKFYKKEFHNTINQYRANIRRRLQLSQ
ncbi:unnamed protein product [Adineta steineri]|uniref:Uncharacterized protein n=1 Tax=Adineta steineri TaxID=433720 RepID=A0A819DJD2_9BILA|nr:unnamed protein product [Adineta steineri]CAF3830259.1 unnamed protein product [Adineta steineri]